MTRKILFTGFPGFLGAQLLPRVLERSPGTTALCLVQKKFEQAARARATELIGAQPSLEGRIELVEGDITFHGGGCSGWRLTAMHFNTSTTSVRAT